MHDRPIPASITLKLKEPASTGEAFIGLSATLYQQNLIFPEPRELRRERNALKLIVIFRDVPSCEHWMENPAVREYWTHKFEDLLQGSPETKEERDVILEVDQVVNCSCAQPDFYILQGRTLLFIDELVCGSCSGQIPYSRIPLEIEIENWQRHYQRTYLNWLESGLFEQEAYDELTNYTQGKLNLAGEELRKQLAGHFQAPVYLRYFEPTGNMSACPICGQKGEKLGTLKVCKGCRTVVG